MIFFCHIFNRAIVVAIRINGLTAGFPEYCKLNHLPKNDTSWMQYKRGIECLNDALENDPIARKRIDMGERLYCRDTIGLLTSGAIYEMDQYDNMGDQITVLNACSKYSMDRHLWPRGELTMAYLAASRGGVIEPAEGDVMAALTKRILRKGFSKKVVIKDEVREMLEGDNLDQMIDYINRK